MGRAASKGTGKLTAGFAAAAVALGALASPSLGDPQMSVREGGPLVSPGVPPEVAAQYEWPDKLPTPEALFERHVKTCGGAEAMAKTESRLIRGTIVNNETGYRAVLNTYQLRPDKLWMEFRQPGVGKQVMVFDGEIAWVSTGGPAQLMHGLVLRDLALSADFLGDAGWRDRYVALETIDFGVIENEPVARVRYKSRVGKEGVHAFSLNTGLIVATQTISAGSGGKDELLLILMKDYKDFEGYKLPTRILQKTENSLTETVYRQVLVDAPQPERVSFERPPEVVEQFEKIKAMQKEAAEKAGQDAGAEQPQGG